MIKVPLLSSEEIQYIMSNLPLGTGLPMGPVPIETYIEVCKKANKVGEKDEWFT